ncbi:glucose/arabinose dehydrogenase [Murinocardiopsis flavida]|uniref:Glucose/arabinose dehydrogenase n=1 Tax=Murinocardiopsis flavida TaxID=645275 RepID=A0A2P8DLE8_9ACTN|nr:PQQ-dependent sugar dehydrogenase [Murinocardiopsis flavida]PSK98047.1 glucose/arabinose dehydrogenase [Murinocardiopsis flavida]
MRSPLVRLLSIPLAAVLAAGFAAAPPATAEPTKAAESDFDQVQLAKGGDNLGETMGLAVLPDTSVLTTSRSGEIYYTREAGDTRLAATLDTYTHNEEGVQGIAVDPKFRRNNHVFVYYSPALDTPEGDAPGSGTPEDFEKWKGHNRLSRFTFDPEKGTLDTASEKVVLKVPTNRGLCCHMGGQIDFDKHGNLYLSTGDNSNPFESDGYSPIDDSADRNPAYDARRTSGNTNDLRGKLLRIRVKPNGTYSVPKGNLFKQGTAKTKPEIYAMGLRNPFRFRVDEKTGTVWMGEYGPDAAQASERGPSGKVSFLRIAGPGNYGWPFCTGDKLEADSYADWDFATGTAGPKFDCAGGATNDSRHNTGLEKLPPAKPGWLTYDGASVPELGDGSESPMGGPVYHYDPDLKNETKFPESYDEKVFLYEFGRQWIKSVTPGTDGPEKIEDFPWAGFQLMDMEFGPDGSLYVLDYGETWFGKDPEKALYRIDYSPDDKTPVAAVDADKTAAGEGPLEVKFDGTGSADPDGTELSYAWDFDGDGTTDSTEATGSHTYTDDGVYRAILRVTDATGKTGAAGVNITIGNTPPEITFDAPKPGQFMDFGDTVGFDVKVTDAEDAEIDCEKVTVSFALGHDNHAHRMNSANGCTGSIETGLAGGHDTNQDIYGTFIAEYTDNGAGDLPPVTGSSEIELAPKHRQAEFYHDSQGVEVVDADGAEGGKAVGGIGAGDWIAFDPANFAGTDGVSVLAKGAAGGTVEVRSGAPDGPLVAGPIEVPAGGDFAETPAADITDPGGSQAMYLVFGGDGGDLFQLDALTVTGSGAAGKRD